MQDTDTELAQWRREAREHEEVVERATERRRAEESEMRQAQQVEIEGRDSWNAWADERINSALEQHQNFVTEVTGAALGEIRADLREEFRKELDAATGKLGVELRELIVGLGTEFARLQTEFARRGSQALATETGGLHLRGAYRSDQDYDRLDIVTLDGSSYIARQGSPGPCPGTGWRILASAGPAGPQGVTGAKGDCGPPGAVGGIGPQGKPGPSIEGWRIETASYSVFPIMSDGKAGPSA
jgi:hypothetical protein